MKFPNTIYQVDKNYKVLYTGTEAGHTAQIFSPVSTVWTKTKGNF